MFVEPLAIQKHIRNIDFPNKLDNVIGLQVADFVPNNFARRHCSTLRKAKFNIFEPLYSSLYDGGIAKAHRFGMKVMP